MALHGRTTMLKIQAGVNDSATFTAGNVSGELVSQYTLAHAGRLPREWEIKLREALRAGDAYVFYSYATPIAWRDHTGNWTQPPVKYSQSTTNHQSTVAGFISGYGHIPAQRHRYVPQAPYVPPTALVYPTEHVLSQPPRDDVNYDTDYDTRDTGTIVAEIDAVLAEVAAAGWTDPYTDPQSPALALT